MDTQPKRTNELPSKSVTILVAIYNAKDFIKAKIENLQQISAFDDCWIVLLNCLDNDKESETYRDFVRSNDNVLEIRYSTHINLYPTWNHGIAITNSKYIMNNNVDDQLHPEYVVKCAQYLDDNPDMAVVSSRILMTDIWNQSDHNKWKWCDEMPFHPYPSSTAGPCPMWRRSLHDKYGYFGDYRVIGDARMWEKWLAGGEKFGLLDEKLVLYLRTNQSLERRRDPQTGLLLRELDLQ